MIKNNSPVKFFCIYIFKFRALEIERALDLPDEDNSKIHENTSVIVWSNFPPILNFKIFNSGVHNSYER